MNSTNKFIKSDEFEGAELYDHRPQIAEPYFTGNGTEIGALHKPLQVPADHCKVQYVDYKTYEENRARYPELGNETIVNTDIIDDGFILNKVPDASQNFIIANHALEHSPDPFGTLLNWLGKLKTGGIIFAAIPIAEKCYDKGRPTTSLQHLMADHELFTTLNKKGILEVTKAHLWEFIVISDHNIRSSMGLKPAPKEDQINQCNGLMAGLEEKINKATSYADLITAHVLGINRIYDIHYHTFTPTSYEVFLRYFCSQTNSTLENVVKNGSGECIGIIRKN